MLFYCRNVVFSCLHHDGLITCINTVHRKYIYWYIDRNQNIWKPHIFQPAVPDAWIMNGVMYTFDLIELWHQVGERRCDVVDKQLFWQYNERKIVVVSCIPCFLWYIKNVHFHITVKINSLSTLIKWCQLILMTKRHSILAEEWNSTMVDAILRKNINFAAHFFSLCILRGTV